MKTIQVTDEQYEFFKDVANKMGIQSNRATQYPLFYIQEKVEQWVDPGASWDVVKYLDQDTLDIVGEGDDPFAEEFIDEEGNTHQVRAACCEYVWEDVVDVGPFLTEEAANRHMIANGHHYNQPRTYVYSCWRNYEMQELLRLIASFADGVIIPSQYK